MVSVRGVLSGIDPQLLILGIVFVLVLAVIMFILGRVRLFHQNQGTKTVVSICVSLLVVYGMFRTNWNIERFFYSLGLGEDTLYNLVLLALFCFLIMTSIVRDPEERRIKFRLYRTMILSGLIFIGLKFTPIAYGAGTLVVGIPLLVLGIILWYRRYTQWVRHQKERGWTPRKIIDYKRNSKKKDKITNPSGDQQIEQQKQIEKQQKEQQRVQRKQRLRSQRELQQKYDEYSKAIQIIQKRNNGKIPELNTEEYNKRQKEKEIKRQQEQAKVINQQQKIREEIYGLINEGKKIRSQLKITTDPRQIERLRRDYEEIIHEINKRRKRL
jgi:hypothetical protein